MCHSWCRSEKDQEAGSCPGQKRMDKDGKVKVPADWGSGEASSHREIWNGIREVRMD